MAKLIPVLPLSALKNQEPVCLQHRGVPYCLVRLGKKKVKAFVTVCSHKDLAMFPPDVKKKHMICPFHEVEFSATTGKVTKRRGKKVSALPKAGIEVIDGIVHLETRRKHRKLVPKGERKWVEREGKKLAKKRLKAEREDEQ